MLPYYPDSLTSFDWAYWCFVQAITEPYPPARIQHSFKMWENLFEAALAGEL